MWDVQSHLITVEMSDRVEGSNMQTVLPYFSMKPWSVLTDVGEQQEWLRADPHFWLVVVHAFRYQMSASGSRHFLRFLLPLQVYSHKIDDMEIRESSLLLRVRIMPRHCPYYALTKSSVYIYIYIHIFVCIQVCVTSADAAHKVGSTTSADSAISLSTGPGHTRLISTLLLEISARKLSK